MKRPGLSHLLLAVFTVLMLLQACNTEQQNQVADSAEATKEELQFGSEIMKVKSLTSTAKDIALTWGAFEDFEVAVTDINGTTISELKNTCDRLIMITDSLAVKIPDSLNTQPIRSRLVVVTTEVELLKQESNKSALDSSRIASRIETLREAVSEFYFHIDEKLQKDAIDLQRVEDEKKELEKQKKFLDSVYQAELNDKIEQ